MNPKWQTILLLVAQLLPIVVEAMRDEGDEHAEDMNRVARQLDYLATRPKGGRDATGN